MKKWPKKKRRFHLDTYPGMPWNRGDFVLWHGCKSDDRVCWNTEVGNGRPAWNIQDAAIVTKHLGFSIDIACGGIDNLVRHHDYTLAVAEAVSPDNIKTPVGLQVKTTLEKTTVITNVECEGKLATFSATIDDLLFSASTAEKTLHIIKK